MNIRSILMVVGLIASAVGVADESEDLRAEIIDSNLQRIPVMTLAPAYPRKARRDRIEGEVQVCFDIDKKGRPHRVAVRRSSNRAFERPSVRAVRASSFEPLIEGQALSPIKTCRLFVFSLVREDD